MRTAVKKAKATNRPESKKPKINPFHQRLARLTHYQACQLLGPEGRKLILAGSQKYEVETDRHVYLGGDLYRVRIPTGAKNPPVVTIAMNSGREKQLQLNCEECSKSCEHMGAALGHLLEAKSTMGLAAPPDEAVPLENLTDSELLQRALAERQKRADEEKMQVRAVDKDRPWSDYVVTSTGSGKTYRVALRGLDAGQSYCSCPDFRTTVINVDLPWNPAILEQRIARAHRMGQKNPVTVYKLVTEDTIEEKLLETLESKQGLADAALDFDSDVNEITMKSGITNIREKLEKILLPTRPAPQDESQKRAVEQQTESIQQRRERVSAASGQLLSAALQLVGELVVSKDAPRPSSEAVDQLSSSLSECVQRDASGRPQLTISLPDDSALRGLAETLALLLAKK